MSPLGENFGFKNDKLYVLQAVIFICDRVCPEYSDVAV